MCVVICIKHTPSATHCVVADGVFCITIYRITFIVRESMNDHDTVVEFIKVWRGYADIKDVVEKRKKRFECLIGIYKQAVDYRLIEALGHQVHGSEYEYIYPVCDSTAIRLKTTDKIVVVCPIHGRFSIRLSGHLLPTKVHPYGMGCIECLKEMKKGHGSGKRMNTSMFISKAERVHGSRYDYRFVKYIDSNEKVDIICLKCSRSDYDHIFSQTPNSHLNNKGCPNCGYSRSSIKRKLQLDTFIQEAREIHLDAYDYIDLSYSAKDGRLCVRYRCKRCDNICYQRTDAHLKGSGCKYCTNRVAWTFNTFVKEACEILGDKYEYMEFIPNPNKGHTLVIRYKCKLCGQLSEQRIDGHLKGHGCKLCKKRGTSVIDITVPHRIFLIKIHSTRDGETESVYKVGCTKHVLHKHLINEILPQTYYVVVRDHLFTNGRDASNLEQDIIRDFSKYQYEGTIGLRSGDTTGMFTEEASSMIMSYIDDYVNTVSRYRERLR